MIGWPDLSKGRFVALLVLGLAVRILCLPLPGTSDLRYFGGWALAAADLGVRAVYPLGESGASVPERSPDGTAYALPVTYPPGTAWYLGAAGWFSRQAFGSIGTTALGVLVKIPVLFAEALIAMALWYLVRRRMDESASRRAVLGIWLNPALILSGAVLGYQDMVAASLMMASLVAAIENRVVLALILGVTTVLTKQLGLFYLPVLFTIVIMQAPTRRVILGSLGAAVAAVLILAPWLVHHETLGLSEYLVRASNHRYCSSNAMNIWWLWTYRMQDPTVGWNEISTHLICPNRNWWAGVLALIVFTTWNLSRMTREPSAGRALLAAGLQSYVYATVAIGVHENHILWAIPALAAVQIADVRLSIMYWAVSGVAFANLAVLYGLGPFRMARDAIGIDSVVLGAVASLMVAAYVLRTVLAKDLFQASLGDSVAQRGALFDRLMARLGQAVAERRA